MTKPTYKIGAVEKLTGIPAVTIRVWERRYGAVEPHRTPSNGRLYSRSQVARLAMLKRLVDSGDAISTIAALSDVELSGRLGGLAGFQPERAGPVGVVLVGSWGQAPSVQDGMVVLASYPDIKAAMAAGPVSADALVVELSIVTPETDRMLVGLCSRFTPSTVLVVYQFGAAENLLRLHRAGYHTVVAPLRWLELQRTLPALVGVAPDPVPADGDELPAWLRQPVPPRRFGAQELQQISQRPSAIRCECPQHLTGLISRLLAFEEYSRDCESRNIADASLHMQLHQASAHARAVLEDALARLLRHEEDERG